MSFIINDFCSVFAHTLYIVLTTDKTLSWKQMLLWSVNFVPHGKCHKTLLCYDFGTGMRLVRGLALSNIGWKQIVSFSKITCRTTLLKFNFTVYYLYKKKQIHHKLDLNALNSSHLLHNLHVHPYPLHHRGLHVNTCQIQ